QHLFDKEREGKVRIMWNHSIDEVLGDDSGVNGLRVASVADGTKTDLEVTGFFVAVGHAPNTQLFEGQLEMKNGYLIVKSGLAGAATQTSIPGVFAAGDVRSDSAKRVASAVGEGAMAVMLVHRYLANP
ncbi:MAG: FAD-dependent oxidoreductase, partial [Rhodococcus fascians]